MKNLLKFLRAVCPAKCSVLNKAKVKIRLKLMNLMMKKTQNKTRTHGQELVQKHRRQLRHLNPMITQKKN